MNSKLVILIVTVLINLSTSQISKISICPNIKPVDNFDQKSIVGKWYEAKRYPSSYLFGTCVTINIKEVNGSISILTNQTFPGMKTTPQNTIFGKRSVKKGEAGSWNFKIGLGLVSTNATLTVVDTDYKNYAVFYGCGTFFGYASVNFAWIYTRQQNASLPIVGKAMDALKRQNIDTDSLLDSVQIGC